MSSFIAWEAKVSNYSQATPFVIVVAIKVNTKKVANWYIGSV